MKRLFVALAIVLFATTAWAAPYLVCDKPTQAITSYQLTGPSWMPTSVTAETDGTIHMDVAAAVVGVKYDITVKACMADVWSTGGVMCSESVPFSFTRTNPATTVIKLPVNTRLAN